LCEAHLQVRPNGGIMAERATRSDEPDLKELLRVYADIALTVAQFRTQSSLSCPSGCGACCDRADTEVTVAEAALIARWLRSSDAEAMRRFRDRAAMPDRTECVFYRAEEQHHCAVYEVRPLICRMFGDSGFTDRAGTVYFQVCPHMHGAERFAAGGGAVRVSFPPYPPIMSRFQERIRALHGDRGARKQPLAAAVLHALGGP
jgi:Fe-S-cluster containining protein